MDQLAPMTASHVGPKTLRPGLVNRPRLRPFRAQLIETDWRAALLRRGSPWHDPSCRHVCPLWVQSSGLVSIGGR